MTDSNLPVGLGRPAALSRELESLLKGAREYQLNALAPNTLRAYQTAWLEFDAFCARRGVSSLPADGRALEMYLKWCADMRHFEDERGRPVQDALGKFIEQRDVLKLSAIEQRVAAIATVHRLNDFPSPTDLKSVQLTLDGIFGTHGRERGSSPKRALTRDDIRQMVGRLGNSRIDVRDRAILLLGFLGGCRRSELASMRFEDVTVDGEGLVYTLWRSKTNRLGRKGPQRKAIARSSDPAVCPVRAFEAVRHVLGINTGFVFRSLVHGVVGEQLSDRSIHAIVFSRLLDGLCEWLAVNVKDVDGLCAWLKSNVADEHVKGLRLRRPSGAWIRSHFTPGVIGAIVTRFDLPPHLDPRTSGAHGLRSGFVTTARNDGKSDFSIMEQTGHASSVMLDHYTHKQSLWDQNASKNLL